MKSYAVIGLGRFGATLARQLRLQDAEVLAVDVRSDLVDQIGNDVTHAVCGDSQDKELLRSLGIGDFDCAVIAIGNDLAASVLTVMNVMELRKTVVNEEGREELRPYVICKAHDETHRRVLEKLGADRVIIPEQENAQRLARSLYASNVLEYIELSGDYGIMEIPAPKILVGKTLKESNIPPVLGVNVIAVEKGKEVKVSPAADYRVEAKDILVVLGDNGSLEAMQKL